MNKEFKRMMELAGLAEIKINQPNPLNYLLNLQSKIKATEDPLEKLSLAIQCVERVLFIFEEKFPNDKRPRKAIEVAKAYLANPTEENKNAVDYAAEAAADAAADADAAVDNAADNAATDVAAAAYYAAYATYTATNTVYATSYAIKATKEYYNLNEIKINQPNPLNYLLNLQSKIEATDDPLEKLSLAIQSAEKVLFIWEEKYPDDKRPRKSIEAAKAYLANPTEENKKAVSRAKNAANDAALDIYHTNSTAALNVAYAAEGVGICVILVSTVIERYINNVIKHAIIATKRYYNLNEIKVNQPNNFDNLYWTKELYDFFKNDQGIFKNSGIDSIIKSNINKILDNIWKRYLDIYQEYEIEDYDNGELTDYPKTKKDLFNPNKQTGGSDDAEYFGASEFLFPYILKHLKENGWEHVEYADFSKDGREEDIFFYIKPFTDQDTDPREGLGDRFENYIEENY